MPSPQSQRRSVNWLAILAEVVQVYLAMIVTLIQFYCTTVSWLMITRISSSQRSFCNVRNSGIYILSLNTK